MVMVMMKVVTSMSKADNLLKKKKVLLDVINRPNFHGEKANIIIAFFFF